MHEVEYFRTDRNINKILEREHCTVPYEMFRYIAIKSVEGALSYPNLGKLGLRICNLKTS